MEMHFYPEGTLLNTPQNEEWVSTQSGLATAAMEGAVLEGRVAMCDARHNLHIELPCMKGIISREEGAIGIAEGVTRDIALISRVGKPVSFMVIGFENTVDGIRAVLSRRAAQEACRNWYFTHRQTGDIIRAQVTRLESFGAFCDIGCGVTALMPIAGMSVSRISHPRDRVAVGMEVCAVILSMEDGRICLSQRELLGTWEENVSQFSQGETVMGIVRSIEPYGVFIELTPNLAGLAEPRDGLTPGQTVSVYIKSILADKMKVKLIVIDEGGVAPPPTVPHYFISEGHIDRFVYSPPASDKRVEMVF